MAAIITDQIRILNAGNFVAGVSNAMNVIGSVENKRCIIVEDLGDSGGTICNAEKACNPSTGLSPIVYTYLSEGNLASVRGRFGVFLSWLSISGASSFNMAT